MSPAWGPGRATKRARRWPTTPAATTGVRGRRRIKGARSCGGTRWTRRGFRMAKPKKEIFPRRLLVIRHPVNKGRPWFEGHTDAEGIDAENSGDPVGVYELVETTRLVVTRELKKEGRG